MNFAVPNWAQSLIAKGAGLDPDKLMVRMENDRCIVFLQHMPRKEYMVTKADGERKEM